MRLFVKSFFSFLFLSITISSIAQEVSTIRIDKNLDTNWRTVANDSNKQAYAGFEKENYEDKSWKSVDIPHNWDDYGGYRRLKNGNRYGYAWYRKTFFMKDLPEDRRIFLWFEGVGSYATVWLNGIKVGTHAGGRTSFTIDITQAALVNDSNLLCVRADHPQHIRDLPWVSGGDANEIGFSEGSQPMGIFRPVHLIVTNQTRIIPFGVHAWNDTAVSSQSATLYTETTLKNYNHHATSEDLTVINTLKDSSGTRINSVQTKVRVSPGKTYNIKQKFDQISHPHLWYPDSPYLYTIDTKILKGGQCIDQTSIPYGIRWISWPQNREGNNKQFLVNGKPVYINGVCGYEHLLGQSHAFSAAQIKTRVKQVEAAGFNAFRDAHQPHNLRFQHFFENDGILWWPQFAAHIWFDNPAFKKNFKKLLHDWVIERRNNPSIILWGLENESTLPKNFAKECVQLIRKLDPTASGQRLITTCNGGEGTDWNVPQNWSGTYGGNPYNYAAEVQEEKLIGEYGAWRSIDLHTEGNFFQEGPLSEDRMSQLLELKVKQADSVKDKFCGQFMWLLHSHDNPGRVQSGEGYRAIDRVGPVNYKGLFTIWGEPVDAFYMYRANYVSPEKHPMVYIVSHTWPDRWIHPGRKYNINIYSNCDSVELFNDLDQKHSLGTRKRSGVGSHFHWDSANIQYNVLYAIGYVHGKKVATDRILLHHLPKAPHFSEKINQKKNITRPSSHLQYLYRVNCGGPTYKDKNENIWMADRHLSDQNSWGSISWTDHYKGLPPYFASQRRTFDLIKGTADQKLFQTFRYGRHDLKYVFPVPDGDYTIELYFIEPWFGIGGGMDCQGWRLFDVAVNNKIQIHNLDIWKEVGTDHALKKTLKVHVTGGRLILSFPKVNSVQAVISAIAIAKTDSSIPVAPPSPLLIDNLKIASKNKNWRVETWLDTGMPQYTDTPTTFSHLPSELYGAEWIQHSQQVSKTDSSWLCQFKVNSPADVFIGIDSNVRKRPSWLEDYSATDTYVKNDEGQVWTIYHKQFDKGQTIITGTMNKKPFNNYFIAAKYATTIMPTYDLKPVTHYHVKDAKIKGKGISVDKEFITFNMASNDTISWKIKPGLAAKYSLRIRYANTSTQHKHAVLYLISNEGIVMQTSKLTFPPTKPGKKRTVGLMTKTRINAGTYTIRLVSTSAKDLKISGLDTQ